MKRSILGGAIAASIATAALVLAVATPAMAATPTPKTLAEIKTAAATATSEQIADLNAEISDVSADTCLSAAHKSTILGTLNADLTGVSNLAAVIAADTDVKTAAAHLKSVATDFRVHAVAIPQSNYAAAADCITGKAIPALIAAQTKLAAHLAGKSASKSTPDVVAKMADLAAQIATATSASNGVAAAALAVTPASFNANRSILSSVKSSISAANAAVKAAKTDIRAVATALK
jgi:hypothetical protein